MTAKQIFEYALVELNKKEAPSLLLEDYNYFINKTLNQWVNEMYNLYEINQQKTDDLRVLKGTAVLTPTLNNDIYNTSALFKKIYEVNLPDDYLHILNCIVEYKLLKTYKCYDVNSYWQQGAKRLAADQASQVINNYYFRPSYKNPYYYINNVTNYNDFPTTDSKVPVISQNYVITLPASENGETITISAASYPGTDLSDLITKTYEFGVDFTDAETLKDAIQSDFQLPSIDLVISGTTILSIPTKYISTISTGIGTTQNEIAVSITPSNINAPQIRYGNSSKVRMEIRYGKDDSIFKLDKVYIDYLKAPQFIRLTQEQVDEVEDNSQVLEFPDYVCQELVNKLVKLLLENSSDPRIQTHPIINTSIATPGQEQQRR